MRRRRVGFTLTEMLIAMAITLLLMAALAKSFGVVGESIRDGRARVELTSVSRDVTLRINDELDRCTVPLNPPTTEDEGAGYFLYYEGPLTDHTAAMMGQSPGAGNEQTYQDAIYGDLDDYLAFTAVAQEGNWFHGKVPRFVLDQKTAELAGNAYDPTNFPGSPIDPVMIKSKYAEIIYFAAPEYRLGVDQSDPTKRIFDYIADGIGNPRAIDADGNGLPDRIRLHRRVLLIRPDLNLIGGLIPPYAHSTGGGPAVEYLAADAWPADNSGGIPSIKTQATHGVTPSQIGNAWLIGMAPVHQQCDLSLRRVVARNGQPTANVAANSLEDLTHPENRFAHVRMPGNFIDSTHHSARPFTTMPLLALGARQPILDPATGVPPSASGAPVVTPQLMNGFLRPEFILGMDHTHTDFDGDGWGIERFGEDILATSTLAFDIKGFDPAAPSYITSGIDGQPGVAAFDDDANGTDDDNGELGYSGSDDVVVTPNDVAFREALHAISQGSGVTLPGRSGGFVDLAYPVLAGGTVRGPGTRASDVHGSPGTTVDPLVFRTRLETPLSGITRSSYRLPNNSASPGLDAWYTRGMYKSGRVITTTAGAVVLIQPAYDTFSDHYERDGFLQTFPSFNNGSGFGTVWYLSNANGSVPSAYRTPDLGANGIDDGGLAGADDDLERETESPFAEPLSAIRVSVRLENNETQQIQQMSSVRRFNE